MRSLLLRASESQWLATRLPNYPFARRAVKRFMPGETTEDALRECANLQQRGIRSVITRLGENVRDIAQANGVTDHYVDVLGDIGRRAIPTHVSVKLTQLGLDIDAAQATGSVVRIMNSASGEPVWIDIESSKYTDITLDVFNKARDQGSNVGLCIQSYLRRTTTDLDALLQRTSAIRLVKGAYKEPADVAFPAKSDVDENYVKCAFMLLERAKQEAVGYVPAFATHDVAIVRQIIEIARQMGVSREQYEFQMLYGINTAEQNRLAREGFRIRVLISYGEAWFAWYMRRLAERPANVWFVVKSVMPG